MNDASEEAVVQRGGGDNDDRRTYELEETGFLEVPKRWRKFYRVRQGPDDELAPNEVVCPVCKVVIRSYREYRPGDRAYCMPCMSRLVVVERDDGTLEADVVY
ncbi:MAG: hypothetical protein R2735_11485 [Microthrixaceae bacterium]